MTTFDPSSFLEDELDEIERKTQTVSGVDDAGVPVSSGCLALDWVLGGGFRPAWYTNAGGEQSAKTTSALLSALSCLKSGRVGSVFFWDYEGSTGNSQAYVESLAKSLGMKQGVDDLFGQRDPLTGKWLKKPQIRYYSESIGDKFFNHLHATLKNLPDKRKLGDKWWYIYEDTKENQTKYKDYVDGSMPKKYGKGIYIEAPNGDLQALYVTDSYPAMNPLANDDEENNRALGLTARFFADQLPRVKGKMIAKRVAVLGINQLRDKPMAMYESPVYEPGGTALKFYSDVRVWHTSRALSAVKSFGNPTGKGRIELEKSLLGGNDKYRYVHLKGVKNKLAMPDLEAYFRIWISDSKGEAQGICPVFDTIWYLITTGQLKMRGRKTMRLSLHKLGESDVVFSWMDMKKWVLGSNKDKKEVSTHLGYKPMDIRKYCFKQMESGLAMELYANEQEGKGPKAEDD